MPWRNQRSTAKGLAAGAVGGLIASWIMGNAHLALNKLTGEKSAGRQQPRSGAQRPQQQPASDETQANVRAAVAIAEAAGTELEPEQKQLAGTFVHYAFGTIVGGLYGAAAEHSALTRAGAGTAFGSALWLLSDEIAVPVLKLAKPPREYALEVHATALAAHLIYGFTTEMIRRGLRAGALAR